MKGREFPGTVASASASASAGAALAIGSTAGPAVRTASAATKKSIENESKGHTLSNSHGSAERHHLRPDLANFMI